MQGCIPPHLTHVAVVPGYLKSCSGIETSQVLRLNCTLLAASQKKTQEGGRATLKLLESATLAKINAECRHPNDVI